MALETAPLSKIVGTILMLWSLGVFTLVTILVCRAGLNACCNEPTSRSKQQDVGGSITRRLWARLLHWHGQLGHERLDASMVKKISEQEKVRQLARCRFALNIGVHALLPVLSLRLVMVGKEMLSGEETYLRYNASYLLVPPFQAICILCFFFPAAIGTCTTRLAFALLVTRSIAISIAQRDGEDALDLAEFQAAASILFRVTFQSVVQDTKFACISQGFACIAMIVLAGDLSNGRWRQVVRELFYTALLCMTTACLQLSTRQSIQNEIEASSSKTFEKAADALLSSMCDAVIHLSSDMRILKDCPRLCALLLQNRNTSVSLNFCDFILSENDKDVFRSFITRPPHESMAETIHISLCDSNSTDVPVQIFHTQCVGLDDQVVHLVGILDAGWEKLCQEIDFSPFSTSNRVRDEAPMMHAISEYSLCSSTLSLNLDTTAADNDVKVWVSTSEAAFELVKYTPGFLSFVGRSALPAAERFSSFVVHREAVLKDLQHLTNLLLNDPSVTSLPWQCMLYNSSMQRLIDAQGLVELDMDFAFEPETADNSEFVLMINFTSWRQLRPKRRHTKPPAAIDFRLSL